jgi:acetyl-CoA/propionyl-CoA carboxylase, biotin carboxylase, biotin carboxyl carrier protein
MEIKYKNDIYDVEYEKADSEYIFNINGEKLTVPVHLVNDNCFSVKISGKSRSIYAAENDDHLYVSFDGDSFVFDKVKEEEKEFTNAAGSENIDEIHPPMPGSIVKVLVVEGQKVAEGEGIVIVEAMKMESTLYSAIDGVVTSVKVEAGQQVDSDDILVVIEKE